MIRRINGLWPNSAAPEGIRGQARSAQPLPDLPTLPHPLRISNERERLQLRMRSRMPRQPCWSVPFTGFFSTGSTSPDGVRGGEVSGGTTVPTGR